MQEDAKDDALSQMRELKEKVVALNAAALALEDYLKTEWDEATHDELVEALGGNLAVDKDEFQSWVEGVVFESQSFIDSSDKALVEAEQAPVEEPDPEQDEDDEDGDSEAS